MSEREVCNHRRQRHVQRHGLDRALPGCRRGLVVAHIWRGYGSALFIEFGALVPSIVIRKDGTPGAPSGEIGLMIGADWRIEDANTIVCGSDSEEGLWKPAFARLIGKHVVDVATFGRLSEILISLSATYPLCGRLTNPGVQEDLRL